MKKGYQGEFRKLVCVTELELIILGLFLHTFVARH